jgi:selenium metabolism protein YedF
MKIVDARGETCPVPVIMLKKALQETKGENIKAIVDNELSCQNIEKMLAEKGLKFHSYREGSDYVVEVDIVETDAVAAAETKILDDVIILSSNTIGRGDDALGATLMKNFLYALTESDSLPSAILMYNSGVKLASENPDTIADIKKLESRGVKVMVCGLCLNYFGLTDKLQAGSVTNMYSIVQTKLAAKKLIQI